MSWGEAKGIGGGYCPLTTSAAGSAVAVCVGVFVDGGVCAGIGVFVDVGVCVGVGVSIATLTPPCGG